MLDVRESQETLWSNHETRKTGNVFMNFLSATIVGHRSTLMYTDYSKNLWSLKPPQGGARIAVAGRAAGGPMTGKTSGLVFPADSLLAGFRRANAVMLCALSAFAVQSWK